MDSYEFYENLMLVVMTYLITSLLFLFMVWGYEGFAKGFTSLDVILMTTQLIGLGCIIGIPLIISFFYRFKIVRR